MDLQLKDKVVLITGGAKGIGAAIARGCSREGAIPVFIDKDAELLYVRPAQVLTVARFQRVEGLVAFLEQVRRQAGMRLPGVPRAIEPQRVHDPD